MKINCRKIGLIVMVLLLLANGLYQISAQPVGGEIIFNETDNVQGAAAAELTTAGGSFTTMVLNITQQNARWKAYVGNVTGEMVLADSNDRRIYDWDLVTITGEVFASRSNDLNWTNIGCVSDSILSNEEDFLNITTSDTDSINQTFDQTTHKEFWVGSTYIQNSSCRAIATYVNEQEQVVSEDAKFQEILLDDNSNMVYATVLEQDEQGYDAAKTFDFQMILAEDKLAQSPTTYYFYAEIG